MDTRYHMDESQNSYTEWTKTAKKVHVAWFYSNKPLENAD